MLQPLRTNPRRQRVAIGRAIPPPTEGWDATSPLAEMDPRRAVVLENFFPQPGYIEIRKGHVEHASTGLSTPVETLMPYNGVSSSKLFAAAGTAIYDVTAGGASSSVVTGLNGIRFRYASIATAGGNFLWICNGVDDPRHFDGATWATPSLTGVTANTIRSVTAHKTRLWFVLNASLKAGYLAVGTIAGAVTTFDFGPLMTRGGRLVAIESWTVDGGDGPDDYLVFVSSRGQVAVYQGTDPGSAATWALVGLYNVGAPIGDRPMLKVGGDVALISVDGVLPLSLALRNDRAAADRIALTARIDREMNAAARSAASNFGWQLLSYPRGTMAILNVPLSTVRQDQFVMNVLTGAWCRFKGMNGTCWETMDDRLFFGGNDGKVYEADRGANDNGQAFVADMKTAFNYFGMKGLLKKFGMIQSLFTTDGRVPPSVSLDIDFRDGVTLGAIEPPVASDTLWDIALWDVALWPPEQVSSGDWKSVQGVGQCAAVRLRVSSGTGASLLLQVNGFHTTMETGEFL